MDNLKASAYYLNQLIDIAKNECKGETRHTFTDFDISHLTRFKKEHEQLELYVKELIFGIYEHAKEDDKLMELAKKIDNHS